MLFENLSLNKNDYNEKIILYYLQHRGTGENSLLLEEAQDYIRQRLILKMNMYNFSRPYIPKIEKHLKKYGYKSATVKMLSECEGYHLLSMGFDFLRLAQLDFILKKICRMKLKPLNYHNPSLMISPIKCLTCPAILIYM
ncbi:MAG: hypothetical protein ACLFQV_03005 [Vulcanimicrobiota bacterium]